MELIIAQGTEGTEGTPNVYGASGCSPDKKSEGTEGTNSQIPGETERPCFKVFDDWTLDGTAKLKPGVWHFGLSKEGEPIQSWICSPIHIDAVTHDEHDNNFGRLLKFKNTLGTWRRWALPMELLKGGGDDLRGELLGMGVEIDPSTRGRNLLGAFLQDRAPARRIKCATQTGWSGSNFVLPDEVFGIDAANVVFQSGERGHDEFTRKGDISGWRESVARYAAGNPMLTLALSSAFIGPLLDKVNAEGGGIHFTGDSSTGKTTLLDAACSVWGGANYRRSWRSTANGMEGAASLFNDGLLALDEISECDPREIGSIIYALGNGRGKQRASRTGAARGVARWRCWTVSTGERSVSTAMLEGGNKAKAGQGVRILDIPVARHYGCWDNLSGAATGAALSDHIKNGVTTHHGTAGRAFLEQLTRDTRDFPGLFDTFKNLPHFAAADGQVKRGAARFALLALAGELATEYGVTGWDEEQSTNAATLAYSLWAKARGQGNDEGPQIVRQLTEFLDKHGDSRFSQKDGPENHLIRDRAGWYQHGDEGNRVYLFTGAGLREALRGFDFGRALDHLAAAGIIPPAGSDGKKSRKYRVAEGTKNLYPVTIGEQNGD